MTIRDRLPEYMPETTEELLAFLNAMCGLAYDTMERKNHDYAGADGNTPFANFEACEKLDICTTETGLLVRLTDKFKRVIEFNKAKELKVADETVFDTCLDMIVYAAITAARFLPRPGGECDVEVVATNTTGENDVLESPNMGVSASGPLGRCRTEFT